ncbi:MAG: ABC transporter ATP-binding protein [Synergistaceae bacterium]|jgi:zinc transport system ATP-binding protein|nr:ABC transporter ATP-binding protein [Synergistaceae bacterium]
MPVLTVENLSVSYGSVLALEDISFKVEEGEFFCVVGANGSGKSTLIKGILGLIPLAKGTAVFSVERERISYVPQSETADRDFPATVREIVLTGTQKTGWRLPFYTKEDRRAADEALSFFGIEALGSCQIGELSGGQRQRALLARAMCRNPALLFLDEPCAGLDANAKKAFYAMLADWNRQRKVTVVMVSHDLDDVKTYADRVAVLARKLLFLGGASSWAPD